MIKYHIDILIVRGIVLMLAFYLSLIDDESDKQKFERIYNNYYNVLLNTAYGILKERQSAEDAVHEAF